MGRFFSLGQKNANIKVPQKNYYIQGNTDMNIDNNISLNANNFSGENKSLTEDQKKFYKLFGSFGTFFKNLGQSIKNTGSQFVGEVKSWFEGIFSEDEDIQKATGVDTVSRTAKGILGTLEGWFDTLVEGIMLSEQMDQYNSDNGFQSILDQKIAEISPTAQAQQEANKIAFEAKQDAYEAIIEFDVSEKLYQEFLAWDMGEMTLEEYIKTNSQLGELLGSGFESLGGMLPNLITTVVTGGANMGEGLTKLVSFISIFASSNGMSLEQALNSGLEMDEATRKAFAEGLIEASIESMDGRMFGLNLNKELTSGLVKEYMKSVFGEMGEETLSFLLTPMVDAFTKLEGDLLGKYTDFFNNAENADELAATLYTTIMTVTALNSGKLTVDQTKKAQEFLSGVNTEIKVLVEDISNNQNQSNIGRVLIENSPNYFEMIKSANLFLKNAPSSYNISSEFLFGTGADTLILEQFNAAKNKVEFIVALAKNDKTFIEQLGFYRIMDALNEYAQQYVTDNGIDVKSPIENLKAQDAEIPSALKNQITELLKTPFENAKKNEKIITSELQYIAEDNNGELIGLEHAIKTQESAERKVYNDYLKENSLKVPKDLLRYTVKATPDNYVDTFMETMIDLEAKGYEVEKIKVVWPGDSYQGVNVTLKKNLNGQSQSFELQFHTEESFFAKDDGTHGLYEIKRNDNNSKELQLVADYGQSLVQRNVTVPKGAEKYSNIYRDRDAKGQTAAEIWEAIKEEYNAENYKEN